MLNKPDAQASNGPGSPADKNPYQPGIPRPPLPPHFRIFEKAVSPGTLEQLRIAEIFHLETDVILY
jgi:hypothetical protein